jgi:hypothetical protein
MYVAGRVLLAFVIALVSLSAMSLQRDDQSANDTEIRIGNLMPYTGPLAEFSAIGKAEAAYFDMINDRGGINGRKVEEDSPTLRCLGRRGVGQPEGVSLDDGLATVVSCRGAHLR